MRGVLIKSITLLFVPLFFVSCMSTRVYVKETQQSYENGVLQEETKSLSRDGIQKENSAAVYYETNMDGMTVLSRTESTSKSDKQDVLIQLFNGDEPYADESYKVQNGSIIAIASVVDEESDKDEKAADLLRKAYDKVQTERAALSDADIGGSEVTMLTTAEEITVESTPNGSYIFYSIVGKPIVIASVTAWNLVKCAGYACINFIGGYNTVVNGHAFWMMPDVKKAKQKAAEARAANGIKVYPEYHLPFTNNHIKVRATTSETTNVFSASAKDVRVIADETYEYDNTLSVERSASADANSTASVIGLIGTVITVPVSVITWIGGAAFGIYAQTQSN